ncbi:MAG: glycosyltransferase [Nitrospirae bacterium]|nr:glycosyltransferase [Nitrospirota bacterium]
MNSTGGHTFSVIIPSFNEEAHIGRCLESVLAAGGGDIRFEVIVVDNGSGDGTCAIARESGVRVIENTSGKRKTISLLRNTGARASTGSVLVFVDADMLLPANWLREAKEYFEGGFKGAFAFSLAVPGDAGWVARNWWPSPTGNRLKNVDFISGRNFFVNRDVFFEVDGFDETLTTNEDKDLTFRVLKGGYRAVVSSGLSFIHLGCERNLVEFVKKEYWRQSTTLLFARRWGFSLRTLRSPAMSLWHLLFFAVSLYCALCQPYSATLVAVGAWIFPSMAKAVSKAGLKRLHTLAPVFFFLTFLRWHVAGLSLIAQVLRGSPFIKGKRG